MTDDRGLPGEIRVLTRVFEVASVERGPRDVDTGREDDVDALGERLGAERAAVARGEPTVPRRGLRDAVRERGHPLLLISHPGARVVQHQRRNAEPGVRRDDACGAVVGLVAVRRSGDLLDLVVERHVRHEFGRAPRG